MTNVTVRSVDPGRSPSKNNFSLDDLSPEVLQYIKQHKPDIDDPEGFEAKRKNIWDSLKRKARADMYRSRSQSIQGINPDNADQTMATLASPASHSYKHPEKVYVQEIASDEPAPEVVHKNNIWRMYTELLNSVYNQAKRMHPEQLFQWMDQIIQSFVKMLVERDQKTWQELDNKQFFPHISNIAKLDEMVYRLMQDQPEVMHSAPTRSQYNGRWNDYMKGLGQHLTMQGYEPISYTPSNHQISYEFNRKMGEEIVRQGQSVAAMINQGYEEMNPRLRDIATRRL